MLYYLIAFIIIIIDQVTKWIIDVTMEIGESFTIIDQFLFITSHRNQGAAFGILQGQMWFFYVVTVLVIGIIVYYIKKEARNNRSLGIGLGLVLGGAIGNFIDRLFRQEVIDFIDVLIINYDFAIFNIADSALVIGVGIIMIYVLLEERRTKEKS
ncbi:signal peptidase II [Desertibacillus haloalkaliphilus]|nr:signal peptidase II [Desertibacillus haloalkaliphilus]